MARGGFHPTYFSPAGQVISYDYFRSLTNKDPEADPYLIKAFKNEKVHVALRHTKSIQGARDIPKEYWKMFEVDIENIVSTDSEGFPLTKASIVKDPDSRGFSPRIEAEKYYDKFLAKYTDSSFDAETGVLNEVGNTFTPPNPDKPTVSEDSPMSAECGSW